ncbi:MAG: TolC family protein [Candidatus Omnitrophota bacterium]
MQNFDPLVFGEERILKVSLEEVTDLALKNNFDIQLSKYDAWIKDTEELKTRSIYDTFLEAKVDYRKDESAQPTIFSGTQTTENDYNIGLSKKFPTGTTIAAEMLNERQSSNSTFTTSPLIHESTLELSVDQALGKNFLGIQDRGEVRLNAIEIENARYTSLTKIEQSVADVQRAYWDLVLQSERVEIEKDMVEQAKKLFDLQQKKLDDGLVELPDAIASEANYERSKNRLLLAQNIYKRKVNVLKLSINSAEAEILIEPVETLSIPELQIISSESLERAFLNRRDYKEVMNDIKSNDILLTMSKNDLWPDINLTASLARNGLGDHFSDSARTITSEDNPSFFTGLTFVIPLENRKARAQLKAAELQKARALLDAKFIEKKIAIDIIDQVRDCNIFAEVARNEQMIAGLQIKKLDEELKRFNHGRSDTDTIIRFQEDVILARLSAAEAKFQYHIAVIDLKRKESTLLSKYWDEKF